MNNKRKIAATLALSALAVGLTAADALAAGGGGSMPYSPFLEQFRTSLSGEIPMIISVIAIVCGVGGWIVGGELAGMMMYVMRAACGAAIILGVTTFVTSLGVAGSAIPLRPAAHITQTLSGVAAFFSAFGVRSTSATEVRAP